MSQQYTDTMTACAGLVHTCMCLRRRHTNVFLKTVRQKQSPEAMNEKLNSSSKVADGLSGEHKVKVKAARC